MIKTKRRAKDEFLECLEAALRASSMLKKCDVDKWQFYSGQETMAEMLLNLYIQIKRQGAKRGKK